MGFPKWNESTLKILEGSTGKICSTCCGYPHDYEYVCDQTCFMIYLASLPSPVSGISGWYTLDVRSSDTNGCRFSFDTGTYTIDLYFTDDDCIEEGHVVVSIHDTAYPYTQQWGGCYTECVGFEDPPELFACTECTAPDGGYAKWYPGCFTGWVLGMYYDVGDIVYHGSVVYQSLASHYASEVNEPGVGGSWGSFWTTTNCPDLVLGEW